MKAILLVVAGIFLLGIPSGMGAGNGEKERLAVVKALKLKGVVGENNKGLLEFRGDDRKAESVVSEENASRTEKYREIAEKTGSTPEKVGEQRARQILEDDPPGTWHQDAKGNWSKKK